MSEKEVKVKFSTLYILPKALKRIMYYTEAATGEVSGLGTIFKDPQGHYIVDEVYLLDQESSGADTELNPEAISTLMTDMMKANKDPSKLKFWWHSHANMGVFWSGTDDTCAETLSREFAFSLVVNKAGEKLCRLDIYNPIRITFNHIKIEECIEEDKELQALCEQEVKDKVKTPSYGYHPGKGAMGGYACGGHETDPWETGHGYPGQHSHARNGYESHWDRNRKKKDTRIIVSEEVVSDIERFVEIATRNATSGGSLYPETWKEYILDTLKLELEDRFEKKATCKAFATWDKEYEACTGACKIKKVCSWWTDFIASKTSEIEAKAAIDEVSEIESESSTSANGILE